MDLLTGGILAVVVIALSTALSRRLGVAGPLLLTAIGLGAAWLPFMPTIEVDPEIILVGVLPPLLYAAAVRLPAVEFRRDFTPIVGLAVVLVVITALVLGLFFFWAIPGLGFPLSVALGAILSPTDAVATSIVKKLGISPRVVTMLEGESLLNDATSLVLLRSAVAAVAAGFAFWDTLGAFVFAVAVAVVVGGVVGALALRVRQAISNSAAATAIGFVVPFVAYLPTEHLGGSGLVAAVVAGITLGQGALRRLTPDQRVSDELNWRTVELVLEGGVFLLMGLELRGILESLSGGTPLQAVVLAGAALAIVLLVRSAFVAPLVAWQSRRARSGRRERLEQFSERLDELAASGEPLRRPGRRRGGREGRAVGARRLEGLRARVTFALRDAAYYQSSPLGWKHGTILVWAGMRGVVTLAAAQTLPRDTPERDLLILTAFIVAVGSLLLQGLTLPWVIRLLRIPASDDHLAAAERDDLYDELMDAVGTMLVDPALARPSGERYDPEVVRRAAQRRDGQPVDDDHVTMTRELRVAMIEAMRARLVELSHAGVYSSAALRSAQEQLDAEQIAVELRFDD